MTPCPKCAHRNADGDTICGACGLVFAKYEAHQARLTAAASAPAGGGDASRGATPPWYAPMGYVPASVPLWEVAGRALTWCVLLIWGLWFIGTNHTALQGGLPEINTSWMHNVNLIFHEAGHVLFGVFGRFVGVLGGSLMQLIVPGVVLYAFVWRYANPFGGVVGAWWFGQSLLDIAPYAYDAKRQQMLLLGGGTGSDRPGWHDWHNILTDLGLLDAHARVAWCVDALGVLIMLASLAWGAWLLKRQWAVVQR